MQSVTSVAMHKILEPLGLPVFVLDPAGAIAYYNSALQETLQASSSQLQSARHSAHAFFLHRDVQHAVQTILQSRSSVRVDGIDIRVGLNGTLLADLTLEPYINDTVIGIVHDLTDREQLRSIAGESTGTAQSQQILLRGLMHEINNPLGGIRGSAQLLLDDRLPGAERHDFARGIIADVERIRAMLDQFRQTGIASATTNDWFRLQDLIFEILHNAERGAEHPPRWLLELDLALPEVMSDRTKLGQVLTNLILNALHFTGPSRQVRVRASAFSPPWRRRRDVSSWIQVAVEDAGPGLEGQQAQLFTPFYTTRPGGTGLGLAISQSLVRQLGGHIHTGRSGLGGAEFRVEIPVQLRTHSAPKEPV